MSEKKLPREKVDEAIRLIGEWHESHKSDDYDAAASGMLLTKACDAIEDMFPKMSVARYAILDIISGCIRVKDDCINQDIYKVLEGLGWKVSDDEPTEH